MALLFSFYTVGISTTCSSEDGCPTSLSAYTKERGKRQMREFVCLFPVGVFGMCLETLSRRQCIFLIRSVIWLS